MPYIKEENNMEDKTKKEGRSEEENGIGGGEDRKSNK